MKPRKAECRNCGSRAKVKLYWSNDNLFKTTLKTYYCEKCIQKIWPKPLLVEVKQKGPNDAA